MTGVHADGSSTLSLTRILAQERDGRRPGGGTCPWNATETAHYETAVLGFAELFAPAHDIDSNF